MDSPASVYNDSSEREAVETLLSISKAPSPAGSDSSMEPATSTDPWCLPGDPPPQPVSPIAQTDVDSKATDVQQSGMKKTTIPNRNSKLAQVRIISLKMICN